jgi:histidine decarboxylase
MENYSKNSFGYQLSQQEFDLSHIKYHINNVGDPFKPASYKINTHEDEKFIVEWFGKLFNMENPWGYCSSGSTESILNSLWIARKRFPNAKIYASKDSHFCIKKCADILSMEYVPIQTNTNGSIDIDLLNDKIVEESIVILTLGTTINGAYDSIEDFYNKIKIKNFHLHLDGAFGGIIYPFIKPHWLKYKFDTLNLSFHKFIGCPMPSSLFLIDLNLRNSLNNCGSFGEEMICIPNKDYTISCSRSGISVIFIKKFLDNFDKILFYRKYLDVII